MDDIIRGTHYEQYHLEGIDMHSTASLSLIFRFMKLLKVISDRWKSPFCGIYPKSVVQVTILK